jgi:hypothetical protein
MSLPHSPTAASADDLQEAMRAILIMVSLIIDQLEEGERIQRGHFAKILGMIDEMTLQRAAGDHPAGGERLALGLIRELQNSCSLTPPPKAEPVKRWTPTVLLGGKE